MSEQKPLMSFEEFETDWLRRHRRTLPRRKSASSKREFFWIAFWILVAIGASIFSAAHTIPAAEMTILRDIPSRSALAITAFVIVELVIFGASAGRREIKWLKWLLAASVLVALAGNIGSSIRAVAENNGDWLNQFGGVLLAIIAPVTALAAGEVLHIQLDKRAHKSQLLDDTWSDEMREIDQKINTAFTKYMKDNQTDRQTDKLREQTRLSEQTDNQTDNRRLSSGASGYNRTADGQQRVVDYLNENPDDAALPLRRLAELIGVNKDTVSAGRRVWQDSLGGVVGYNENGIQQ